MPAPSFLEVRAFIEKGWKVGKRPPSEREAVSHRCSLPGLSGAAHSR